MASKKKLMIASALALYVVNNIASKIVIDQLEKEVREHKKNAENLLMINRIFAMHLDPEFAKSVQVELAFHDIAKTFNQ